MSPPTERERRFAAYLEGLAEAEERAALAGLRRGLGKAPGEAAEPLRYVAPRLPEDVDRGTEEAYYLVASLFGAHPLPWRARGDERIRGLGVSFRWLAEAKAKAANAQSTERRFVALLDAHRDELGRHLRHAVSLLAANDVGVDWAQLLHDVRGWTREDREVQRRWARAFWCGTAPDGAAETAPGATAGHVEDAEDAHEAAMAGLPSGDEAPA